MDKDQVIKAVKDEDVKFIRLWFTDVVGQLKSFAITASEIETAIISACWLPGRAALLYAARFA